MSFLYCSCFSFSFYLSRASSIDRAKPLHLPCPSPPAPFHTLKPFPSTKLLPLFPHSCPSVKKEEKEEIMSRRQSLELSLSPESMARRNNNNNNNNVNININNDEETDDGNNNHASGGVNNPLNINNSQPPPSTPTRRARISQRVSVNVINNSDNAKHEDSPLLQNVKVCCYFRLRVDFFLFNTKRCLLFLSLFPHSFPLSILSPLNIIS